MLTSYTIFHKPLSNIGVPCCIPKNGPIQVTQEKALKHIFSLSVAAQSF